MVLDAVALAAVLLLLACCAVDDDAAVDAFTTSVHVNDTALPAASPVGSVNATAVDVALGVQPAPVSSTEKVSVTDVTVRDGSDTSSSYDEPVRMICTMTDCVTDSDHGCTALCGMVAVRDQNVAYMMLSVRWYTACSCLLLATITSVCSLDCAAA